ncbi:MAG: ABC transporter substrate-binding protein [Polyangiales bacterium]|nr:ABC transporter substrate-binding protein [Myxococcales bacterium]
MSRAFSAVFALLLALSVPTVAAAEGPVTQFLKGKHEQVNKLLKVPAKSTDARDARDQKVTAIIGNLLDFRKLSQASLAEAWEERSAKERDEFVTLLQQLVERNYKKNLENTMEYTIKYVDEVPAKGEAVHVTTQARDAKNRRAPAVKIEYLLEPKGSDWAVVDVTTDGVSMVANYRSQFRRIMQKDGWGGLLDRMRKRLDEGTDVL